jgi:6-phosphogluconolactonase
VVAGEQTSRQAHWHGAGPNPAFSYVPDRGIDMVVIYALDTAAPSLARVGEVASSPGAGPRHMAFHPNGRWAYVVGELMMKMIHMDLDLATGMLSVRQEYDTLEPGAQITLGVDKASEVAMHPTGRWVYIANRGRDTITVFAVDPADGSLTTVEREDTRVTTPRHFGMDPTGRYIVAGGQSSNDMTLFAIDQDTGELEFTGAEFDIGSPICFVFAGVEVPPRNAVDLALWQRQE